MKQYPMHAIKQWILPHCCILDAIVHSTAVTVQLRLATEHPRWGSCVRVPTGGGSRAACQTVLASYIGTASCSKDLASRGAELTGKTKRERKLCEKHSIMGKGGDKSGAEVAKKMECLIEGRLYDVSNFVKVSTIE